MTIRQLLTVSVLVAAAAVSASAGDLKVTSFTGTLTITTADGKTLTVKPGEKAPAIHPGDSVSVDGGTAVLEGPGHVKVTAPSGSALTVQKGDGVQIASTGVAPLTVVLGANFMTAVLKSGDAVNVNRNVMSVVAGTVSITDRDGTPHSVEAGKALKASTLVATSSSASFSFNVVNSQVPPAPPSQQTSVVSPSAP